MTDQADKPQTESDPSTAATDATAPETEATATEPGPLDELAELEATIRRRLRRNQLFLERFMDEDFEDEETDLEDPKPEDAQEPD